MTLSQLLLQIHPAEASEDESFEVTGTRSSIFKQAVPSAGEVRSGRHHQLRPKK